MPRSDSPPWRKDDKDGHYSFAMGDNLTPRYKIQSKMGEVMHDMRMRLIHTDLKPDHILLVSSDYVKVPDYKASSRSPKDLLILQEGTKIQCHQKVIDFGSTTYNKQGQSYIVSTRHYRAPVIILAQPICGYSDVAQYACGFSGEAQRSCGFSAVAQLARDRISELLSQELPTIFRRKFLFAYALPPHMLKRADRHAEKYVRKRKLDWTEGGSSRDDVRSVSKLQRLPNLIMQNVDHSAGDLIHLLQGLLKYDTSDRLTARQALRHMFCEGSFRRRLFCSMISAQTEP
ncbi:hypothetical protein QQ045_000071 [Rhodiola kirilowii]